MSSRSPDASDRDGRLRVIVDQIGRYADMALALDAKAAAGLGSVDLRNDAADGVQTHGATATHASPDAGAQRPAHPAGVSVDVASA